MPESDTARTAAAHTFLHHSIKCIVLGHCRLCGIPLGRPQQLLVGSRLQLIAIEQPVGYGQQAGVTAVVLAQDACTAQHVAAGTFLSLPTQTRLSVFKPCRNIKLLVSRSHVLPFSAYHLTGTNTVCELLSAIMCRT